MRFCLICIFLFVLFSKVRSNNTADSLFKNSEFFEAAIEYERLFYYSKDLNDKNFFLYKKSLCYKALGEYQEAFEHLKRISLFGLEQEARDLYNYETAIVAYLAGEFTHCETTLLILSRSSLDSAHYKNVCLIGALNSIMLTDFEASKRYTKDFMVLNNDTTAQRLNELDLIYKKGKLPKLKDKKKLHWIGIVPGFGQMYVGKVGEGLTNLGMNIAAFAFGVYQIWHGFYVTGYFVGALSINKLYFGGRTRAENQLKITNNNKLTEFQARVKGFVLEESH